MADPERHDRSDVPATATVAQDVTEPRRRAPVLLAVGEFGELVQRLRDAAGTAEDGTLPALTDG